MSYMFERFGRSTRLGAAILLSIAAVGAIAGLFLGRAAETQAAPVGLMENGVVVAQVQGPDAVAEASKKVGFAIRQPATFATPANRLESVDGRTGPEGVPGAMREAVLVFGVNETATRTERRPLAVIRQANRSLTQGPGVPFSAGQPGVRAWKLVEPEQAVYSFATEHETFILTYLVALPSDDAVRQMFGSLK